MPGSNYFKYTVPEDYQPEYPPSQGLWKPTREKLPKNPYTSPYVKFTQVAIDHIYNERRPWDTSLDTSTMEKIMTSELSDASVDDVIEFFKDTDVFERCPRGRLQKILESGPEGVEEYRQTGSYKVWSRQWQIDRMEAEKKTGDSLTEIARRMLKEHQARERSLYYRDLAIFYECHETEKCGHGNKARFHQSKEYNEIYQKERGWCFAERELLDLLRDTMSEILRINGNKVNEREEREYREAERRREEEEAAAEAREQAEEEERERAEREEEERRQEEERQRQEEEDAAYEAEQKRLEEEAEAEAATAIADAQAEAADMAGKMAQYQAQMMILSTQMASGQIDAAQYGAKMAELSAMLQ